MPYHVLYNLLYYHSFIASILQAATNCSIQTELEQSNKHAVDANGDPLPQSDPATEPSLHLTFGIESSYKSSVQMHLRK